MAKKQRNYQFVDKNGFMCTNAVGFVMPQFDETRPKQDKRRDPSNFELKKLKETLEMRKP